MTRLFLIVIALGIVVFAIGLLALGTFPPKPQPHPVERVLPNDQFQHAPPPVPAPSGG